MHEIIRISLLLLCLPTQKKCGDSCEMYMKIEYKRNFISQRYSCGRKFDLMIQDGESQGEEINEKKEHT